MLAFEGQAIEVDPAEVYSVVGEVVALPAGLPRGWGTGARLQRVCSPASNLPVPGALLPDTVEVRLHGRVLREGVDYVLEGLWGGLASGASAPAERTDGEDLVEVDYSFSLLRIDAIVAGGDGLLEVRPGESALVAPLPPKGDAGEQVLAHVYVPSASSTRGPQVLPVEHPPTRPTTRTTVGAAVRTVEKLLRGAPVKLVCWGDSVTVGGDASPGHDFVSVLTNRLRVRYPQADLSVDRVAVGASSSVHWLYPSEFLHPVPEWRDRCDWHRVVEAEPDAVVVEFVNDASLDAGVFARAYGDILRRVGELDAELVFVTPHFTTIHMSPDDGRAEETRPYVAMLHDFVQRHGLAVADVSGRWADLWREGLPYFTLLANGINHPDDRGHGIVAEEIERCLTGHGR